MREVEPMFMVLINTHGYTFSNFNEGFDDAKFESSNVHI